MNVNDLVEEARGLKGMIAEIGCKAKILEQRVRSNEETEVELPLEQMRVDIDKYSRRLDQIFEEIYDSDLPSLG